MDHLQTSAGMTEVMCNQCLEVKLRTRAEPRRCGGGYYYRDEKGVRWQGRVCPECHIMNVRNPRKDEGAHVPTPTNRKCRACNKSLKSNRYFFHESCFPLMEIPYGEYEYGGYCASGRGY